MRRTSRRRTALAIAALATAATAASAHDWTNSPWGEADEIGAAKWITPERVRLAADLVTGGKTYHLGIVVDEETPAFAPRSLSVTVLQPDQMGTGSFGPTKMTYNDDVFMGWLGIGPQIDSLGHLGIDHVHYNEFEGTDFAKADGLIRPGIEKIPPMVARGVVLDMAAHFGAEIVPEGTPYTEADIRADAAQGVELGVGVFEVHQILLAKNGIYILENMETRELVADGVSDFMFVLGPARLRGAVQMIVNPIAIR